MSSVYGDHQNMAAPPTIQQQRLKVFRDKAWCRDWPSDKKTLLRSEVESASSSRSSGAKDVGDDEITYAEWRAGYTVVSDRLDYTYLWDIDEVARAIQAPPPLYSNIVVLKEYEALLQSLTVGKLKGERQCVVVTGHPGIGWLLSFLPRHSELNEVLWRRQINLPHLPSLAPSRGRTTNCHSVRAVLLHRLRS